MCVSLVSFTVQPCLWAIKYEHGVLSDSSVLLFCSIHALIQFGDMQTQLDKYLKRALFDDLGSTTALNNEVAAHQDLQKAH